MRYVYNPSEPQRCWDLGDGSLVIDQPVGRFPALGGYPAMLVYSAEDFLDYIESYSDPAAPLRILGIADREQDPLPFPPEAGQ